MKACLSNRIAVLAGWLFFWSSLLEAQDEPTKVDPATLHVPAFDLPISTYLSPQAQQALRRKSGPDFSACPSLRDPANLTIEGVKAVRACIVEKEKPRIDRMQAQYGVNIEPRTIAGVPTEIFTPRAGVSAANERRVLINLHGGGFIVGNARVEAIPIAGVGKIKVVGIDYRMGPEHRFPAASEDVAAVYRALLQEYAPANIGIYGCSAGGRLTAQSIAWFQKASLPRPGAIAISCSGAAGGVDGDSAYIASALEGLDKRSAPYRDAYFGKNPDFRDPLLAPLSSAEVMARFPPALLMSATRDVGLSNVIRTHSELAKLGVVADLRVWEGLGHCFHFDPDLPESHEAYDATVKFFDAHLGTG